MVLQAHSMGPAAFCTLQQKRQQLYQEIIQFNSIS
jgi:hypothetical protein